MSGLVCTPSIVPPPVSNDQAAIANDGFFPDVDPDAVKAAMRVRDSVTPARLRAAVIGAMLAAAPDLAAWAAAQRVAGYATLGEVPPPFMIDGRSALVVLYERAIGCYTKAELIERNRDFDQAGGGQRDVDELAPAPGELRRDAIHAIRDILGVGRTTVELI